MSFKKPIPHANTSAQWGFTLVEMIVTLAVFGIILTIAAFSFKGLLRRNQVSAAASDFVSTLGYARSEAITRGQVVSVCRSTETTVPDNPNTPTPSCSTQNGIGWEKGYIVFADNNGDGVRDPGEALLRIVSGTAQGVTITGNGTLANSICYQADGFFPSNPSNGTVTITGENKTLKMTLNKNGRIKMGTP